MIMIRIRKIERIGKVWKDRQDFLGLANEHSEREEANLFFIGNKITVLKLIRFGRNFLAIFWNDHVPLMVVTCDGDLVFTRPQSQAYNFIVVKSAS